MTVTVSRFVVVSQSISKLHGRDLHWLSSISRQAGPPPCNIHSVKWYAPVICNHVSWGGAWGIVGILVFHAAKPSTCPALRGHFCGKHPAQISIGKCIKSRWRSNVESKAPQLLGTVGMMLRLKTTLKTSCIPAALSPALDLSAWPYIGPFLSCLLTKFCIVVLLLTGT